MIRRILLSLFLLAAGAVPAAAESPGLSDEIEAFLNVIAVAGREEPAREFVRQRLAGLPVQQDAAGNLVLSVGSGEPRKLVACPLGEPGYAVTGIEPDGWVRVFRAGGFVPGNLWDQSHEGNVVMIGGSRGWVPGGVTIRSVHLQQEPEPGERPPFLTRDIWIDVGAE